MQLESPSSHPASREPEKGEIVLRVKFRIGFQDLFGAKEKNIHLPSGSSMSRLLGHLCDTPERRSALMTGAEISRNVVILRNGVPIRGREGLEEELSHGDTVAIFPLLAGG